MDLGLKCDYCAMEIGDLGDSTWQGMAQRYWSFETYYLPVALLHSLTDVSAKSSSSRDEEKPDVGTEQANDGEKWRCWPMVPVRTTDAVGRGIDVSSEYWASPVSSREPSEDERELNSED